MKKSVLIILVIALIVTCVPALFACGGDEVGGSQGGSGEGAEIGGSPVGDGESSGAGSSGEKDTQTKSLVTKHKYGAFDYWLYSPDTKGEDLPLIVYLHDVSEGASGVDGMIEAQGLCKTLYDGEMRLDAYVLMPNLPEKENGWDDVKMNLKELVSYVCAQKKTDTSRIYLTGVGEGAVGVYRIAMTMSSVFAAFAPVGGAVGADVSVASLDKAKITAYVSVDPDVGGAESVMDFMFELGKINDSAEIEVLENYSAADYGKIYQDEEHKLLENLMKR